VAYVATFVVLFLLWLVGYFAPRLIPEGWEAAGAIREVCDRVSFYRALDDFRYGVIDTRPLIYFASLTLLSLFVAVRVVEAKRWK
jgi:ABC-2 type transport system permease protein